MKFVTKVPAPAEVPVVVSVDATADGFMVRATDAEGRVCNVFQVGNDHISVWTPAAKHKGEGRWQKVMSRAEFERGIRQVLE